MNRSQSFSDQKRTSLFSNQKNQNKPSLFSNQNQNQNKTSLFSNQNQNQNQNKPSLFSNQNQNQNKPSLFSNQNQNKPSLFSNQNQNQNQNKPKELDQIVQLLEPMNQNYPFKYILYNVRDQSKEVEYQKPDNMDETLWNYSLQNNPDPERLVPIQISGFQDLKTRTEQQKSSIDLQKKELENLSELINELKTNNEFNLKQKYQLCQERQVKLSHKLLRVLSKLEVLKRGETPFSEEEENFRNKLQLIEKELNKPDKFRGKLNQLIPRAKMIEENLANQPTAELLFKDLDLDTESKETIFDILSQQQKGLEFSIKILRKDLRDIQIMSQVLNKIGIK
ncbi:nucleoporin p54 [Anaeramoeba ignava]|uniref:Nucleoporin p54 n=1 Tax=Anaeramoeba ignava TaxID=1746090 RepID=A0A9Q0LWH7_ANAIG|nr:nucleoporin p54 [Anaeramoeba ignava]